MRESTRIVEAPVSQPQGDGLTIRPDIVKEAVLFRELSGAVDGESPQWERGTTQWKLTAIGQITAPRQSSSSGKASSLLSPASFVDKPRWKPESPKLQ